jgi:hypothetical protein
VNKGGLRINNDAAVLNTDYRPIRGLYAAGELVGGLFYFNYPGGTGLMSGAVFGKIAGKAAANGGTIFKMNSPWPTELRLLKDRKTLAVAFDSGERFELPAEYLRGGAGPLGGRAPRRRRQTRRADSGAASDR